MENKLSNLPPFYAGQRVVCIKTHSRGLVVKDQEYVVASCSIICNRGWVVSVNNVLLNTINEISPSVSKLTCLTCGVISTRKILHSFHYSLFAPIQQSNFPLITFTAIKEKEQEEVLIPN